MRRSLSGPAALTFVIALAVFLALGARPAAAETFLVNTGTDVEVNGAQGTLRHALEHAGPGDEIRFVDNLTVRMVDGFIVPEQQAGITIRGPVTISGGNRKLQAVFECDDVTIVGVTFEHFRLVCARSFPAANVRRLMVQDCAFAAESSLQIVHATNPQVLGCTFEPGADDFSFATSDTQLGYVHDCRFADRARFHLRDCTAVSVLRNSFGAHVELQLSPFSGLFGENTFAGPDPVAVQTPVTAVGGTLFFRNNTFPGLAVQRTDVEVTGNTVGPPASGKFAKRPVLSVLADDIRLRNNPDLVGPVKVDGNVVTGGAAGIVVIDKSNGAAQISVTNNQVHGASGGGIQVRGATAAVISDNLVEDITDGRRKAAAVGIELRDLRGETTFERNQIRRIHGAGVRVFGPAGLTLADNGIESCDAAGIETRGAGGTLTSRADRVQGSGREGVKIGRGWVLETSATQVEDSGRDGILIGPGGRGTIVLGGLLRNGRNGVNFAKKSFGRLRSVELYDNGGAGVLVGRGAQADFRFIFTRGNGGPGIDLEPRRSTPNRKRKRGNADLDFPEFDFVDNRQRFEGTAVPFAVIDLYAAEGDEGIQWFGETVADADGVWAYPDDGPLDCDPDLPITATATRQDGLTTSEFSDSVVCRIPVIPILRASQSSSGADGDEPSETRSFGTISSLAPRSMSDDGRYIVFSSSAATLVAGDNNGAPDVFLHDAVTRTTTHVSSAPGGGFVNGGGSFGAGSAATISGDGRYIFYNSSSSDLQDLVGFESFTGIMRRDRVSGAVVPIGNRPGTGGDEPGGGGTEIATNLDGSVAAFVHNSSGRYYNGDDDNLSDDVYMWTGGTSYEHISRTHDGGIGGAGKSGRVGACQSPRMSSDGNVVGFVSLLTGLVPDGPAGFSFRVYVRDRSAGTLVIASRGPGEFGTQALSTEYALSANGRFVAFETSDALVAADTDTTRDIYVRDLQTFETFLVSAEDASDTLARTAYRPSISGDGRFVAFEFQRTNSSAVHEVWLRDRDDDSLRRISVGFDGQIFSHGEYPAITPDGRYISFVSTQPDLVDGDENLQQDVFRFDRLALDE